jgi:hypothetical protein
MRARLVLVFGLCLTVPMVPGCPKQETLGASAMAVLGPGVINNPENKSLRFDILKFGLDRFCFEMTSRGAPLRLRDDEPVLGRFFAEGCQSQIVDDEQRKALVVQYNGQGFAWTNLTGRVGFKSGGLIEYAPDFQLQGEAMYIYFRPRNVSGTTFQTAMVESTLARGGMAVAGIDSSAVGKQIVTAQLERGFTVVRYDETGETDFALGLLPLGQRPFRPFQIRSDKQILANDRTEVHSAQQDYLGGFEVTDDDQAIYLTLALDGAPAVDVLVVGEQTGRSMINQYLTQPGAAPLNGSPLFAESLASGQLWKRYVNAPKGRYYLVVDNSASVGQATPAAQTGDDRAARVDYAVQVGDAP